LYFDAVANANAKAGLANDAATLANTKAGLADAAATAANDAATGAENVNAQLSGSVDIAVDGGDICGNAMGSTVVDASGECMKILRQGPIDLQKWL
jgi:tRNA A37 threonylcarbamoyladenosine synthetase subunit TsaC/SUA5/YrdC